MAEVDRPGRPDRRGPQHSAEVRRFQSARHRELAQLIPAQADVATEVARLKQQDGGELQVHGSGDLIQTLLKHDLVDGLRLWVFPILLGSGKRLFGEGTIPANLRLVETQVATTGAVLHVYERAGDLQYGTMEVAEDL